MITNERQARITRSQIEKLKLALENTKEEASELDDILENAILRGLEAQIKELEEELEDYDELQNSKPSYLELDDLDDLPDLLIRTRIAKGFTQEQLANLLGMKPQQIQRYEASKYLTASTKRLLEIANVLGIEAKGKIKFYIAYYDSPRELFSNCLARSGIRSTKLFLLIASHQQGRKELEEQCRIPEKLILQWVQIADLMRIKGIGEEYVDLLGAAGIDSLNILRNRRADYIFSAISICNSKKKIVRKLPSSKQVEKWVEQAKELEPTIVN